MNKKVYKKCPHCDLNLVEEHESHCKTCSKEEYKGTHVRIAGGERISHKDFMAGRNPNMCQLAIKLQHEIEAFSTDIKSYATTQYIAYVKRTNFVQIEVNQNSVRVYLYSFKPDKDFTTTLSLAPQQTSKQCGFSIYTESDISEAIRVVRVAYNLN